MEREGNEYLGCPEGRDDVRRRRLANFALLKGVGLTLREWPEWMQEQG